MVFEELAGYFMTEDYPVAFNHEEFAKLRSFADRVYYCASRLQKLGAGSSRIVYAIDDKKVLKLAKNAKGIAQNAIEAQLGVDRYFSEVLATVFNSDDHDQWIESERAEKVKETRFIQLTGVNIRNLHAYLANFDAKNNGRSATWTLDPKIEEEMHENRFVSTIMECMHSYNLQIGDLVKLSSYGEVQREEPTIVLVDYGFTEDVAKDYYSPKRQPQRY